MMRYPSRRFALVALLGAVLTFSCACGAGSSTELTLTLPPALSVTSPALAAATATALTPPTATAREPAPSHTPAPSDTPEPSDTPVPSTPALSCSLSPVAAPTAAPYPGYAQLDPYTGLHATGETQVLDLETYRLRISGLVDRPLELSYDEIRCLPRIQDRPLLVCPDTFEDRATWAGASLRDVLKLAGVQAAARQAEFVGADGYRVTLPLERARQPANFLAYEWEGEPLPRLHGFPLRAVMPAEIGGYWVKWLVEIRVQ
jgi:DMSO/TMAO reductase YedYZ molybdopterin-dependent catalytic subunit